MCRRHVCLVLELHVFTVNQPKESMNSNVILMEQRMIVEIASIAANEIFLSV